MTFGTFAHNTNRFTMVNAGMHDKANVNVLLTLTLGVN